MTRANLAAMDDLTELALATFADASEVKSSFYDGHAVVEVWTGRSARVLSREHVLAARECRAVHYGEVVHV